MHDHKVIQRTDHNEGKYTCSKYSKWLTFRPRRLNLRRREENKSFHRIHALTAESAKKLRIPNSHSLSKLLPLHSNDTVKGQQLRERFCQNLFFFFLFFLMKNEIKWKRKEKNEKMKKIKKSRIDKKDG